MFNNDRYDPSERERMNRKAEAFGFSLGKKLKLAEKRAKMQAWVEKYPLQAAFTTIALAAIFLISSLFPLFSFKDDSLNAATPIEVIHETTNTLSSLHTAQAGKAENREIYNAIGQATIDLKEEFDSLVALRDKSHEDSMRIMFVGYRLKQILNEISPK